MQKNNRSWGVYGCRAAAALTLCGLMAGTGVLAFADDKKEDNATEKEKPKSTAKETPPVQPELPPVFRDLKLTPEQTEKIQATLKSHDSDIEKTWDAFQQSVATSIGLEAMLLVAIEDGLTDSQRSRVQHQRKHLHKKSAPKDASPPAEAKAAPAKSAPFVVEEEIVVIGISLSPEQRRQAADVHASYAEQLEAWREQVRDLHAQLVALEADKVISIEHLLTDAQIKQLREQRKRPPALPAKTAEGPKSGVKSEK